MDCAYALTAEQRQIQQMVRRLARERVAPRADAIDRTAEYPQDMFELLREAGLFAIPFPAEYGGTGSMLSAAVAIEELGRVCYNTAYLLVVQWVPFGAILAGGNDEQKRRLLGPLAAGEIRGAFSTTEPQSGSDVAGIRTRALPCPGGYRINGSKIWCTNSPVADFILVAAKTGEREGVGAINLFIVERGSKGFNVGRKEDKMGARGVPSCPLFLDDVFVPEANRIGEDGRGFKDVMEAFNKSRPLIGARGVGLCQGAIDHCIEFVASRVTWGRPVSENQGIRWMLADMASQTEAARQLTYAAAARIDAEAQDLPYWTSSAKLVAGDTAMRVTTDAVQVLGGYGYITEYPVERMMRDAKITQLYEGTQQIQRLIVARQLLQRAGVAKRGS